LFSGEFVTTTRRINVRMHGDARACEQNECQ
jgi:hypothetical protein